jgi:hypothetical protein
VPKEADLRWLAWSGAALGAFLLVFGWFSIPAAGSNYAEVLVPQTWRVEACMWASAGVGVGIPAVVWLLSVASRASRRK